MEKKTMNNYEVKCCLEILYRSVVLLQFNAWSKSHNKDEYGMDICEEYIQQKKYVM